MFPLATANDPRLAQFERGDGGRFGVMYYDFDARSEFVASYDSASIEAAAAELLRAGMADASKGAELDTLEAPKGLSNDIDNRISFESYSDTHSTLRRIGRVGGGCSGALFGNRLVLTAAHCIFNGAGEYQQFVTFQARRNGSDTPYGTVTSVAPTARRATSASPPTATKTPSRAGRRATSAIPAAAARCHRSRA